MHTLSDPREFTDTVNWETTGTMGLPGDERNSSTCRHNMSFIDTTLQTGAWQTDRDRRKDEQTYEQCCLTTL